MYSRNHPGPRCPVVLGRKAELPGWAVSRGYSLVAVDGLLFAVDRFRFAVDRLLIAVASLAVEHWP